MRIVIAAVGRLKAGPERELVARYVERAGAVGRRIGVAPLRLIEIAESRAQSPILRRDDEARRLLAANERATHRIVLDERGKALSSEALAAYVRRQRDEGCPELAFFLGGPDGNGPAATAAADLVLSLAALTLPHALARVVLAEQLYRAATIISGHPYHRE